MFPVIAKTMIQNPVRIVSDIWTHRYLLGQLIKRDVLLRYRGAMFGVLWIFLSSLLMLGIFAYVFGQVFEARLPKQREYMPFWLPLYSGLIVPNLFFPCRIVFAYGSTRDERRSI